MTGHIDAISPGVNGGIAFAVDDGDLAQGHALISRDELLQSLLSGKALFQESKTVGTVFDTGERLGGNGPDTGFYPWHASANGKRMTLNGDPQFTRLIIIGDNGIR